MGTRVLQLAFSGDTSGSTKSRHHPIKIPHNSVVYSETHDNPPIAQWFAELRQADKAKVRGLLGDCDKSEVAPEFVRLAMSCPARFCIIAMQDVLGLSKNSRMNSPGTHSKSNWSWRLTDIPRKSASMMAHLSEVFERNV